MTPLNPPLELEAGQTITVKDAGGMRLRVASGRLWVTCSGDPNDYFITAGQTLRLGSGPTVLEADAGQARYSLALGQPAQSPLTAASRRISWRTMSDCISR